MGGLNMDKSVLLLQALLNGNRVWVRNDFYIYAERGDMLPQGLRAMESGLFRQVDNGICKFFVEVDIRLQDFILLANSMSRYEWLALPK
jgi:hypothetical protein